MRLYNSLTKSIETFTPFNPPKVGVYTCGPTVYSFVTIGNWRTNALGDLMVRIMKYLGYDVTYIMNITDVGHLTGDNLGDADTGEDKLEKAAKKEQKTAWDIANFYTQDFLKWYDELGLTKPKLFAKATDHIKEQIEMVKKIEEKGFTYKISDGIYFDTKAYEAKGNIYGELSNIDQVKEGARVEANLEKKDPRDFALWRFNFPGGRAFDPAKDDPESKRQMEWESPWGPGIPGWHIECSAMSTKYLGCQFDIHVGGEDLRSTHHPNEIAQSEAATGCKPFVKYWIHGAFLQVDGGRMGKSLGNAYTMKDIIDRGYKPEHLRYFYLTGHYRQPLNFTWENLESAKQTYDRLVDRLVEFKKSVSEGKETKLSNEALGYKEQFKKHLENDLQMPQVLALVWEVVRSNLAAAEKYQLLLDFDQVLGVNLEKATVVAGKSWEYIGKTSGTKIEAAIPLPEDVVQLIDKREKARKDKDWKNADTYREELKSQGYFVEDMGDRVVVRI